MTAPSLLSGLQVFFGDTNAAEARVYARLPMSDALKGCRLTGKVMGPTTMYGHTLSASIALVDRGPGATLLAEAIVPEPCFWSPESPFLYRAVVGLSRGNEILTAVHCTVGIRPLGTAKNRLILEGRPWLLRGVHLANVPSTPFPDLRKAGLSLVVAASRADDGLLELASGLGVALVVQSSGDLSELQRLSRWPAVVLAILPQSTTIDRKEVPNLLLAQEGHDQLAPWADVVLAADADSSCPLPVIASRPIHRPMMLDEVRNAIESVEHELGQRDFCGYIV